MRRVLLRRCSVRPAGWVAAVLIVALAPGLLAGGAWSGSRAPGWIAFARADGIYLMRADGSGVRALRRGGVASEGVADLAWSPDGSRIVFVREVATEVGEFESPELFVLNADGTGLTRLTRNRVTEWSPTWQPVAIH